MVTAGVRSFFMAGIPEQTQCYKSGKLGIIRLDSSSMFSAASAHSEERDSRPQDSETASLVVGGPQCNR
jgi:hypothetical protein